MTTLLSKVQKRISDKAKREAERQARAQEEQRLQAALRERNIYPENGEEVKTTSHDYRVRWDEEDEDMYAQAREVPPEHDRDGAGTDEELPQYEHKQGGYPVSVAKREGGVSG